MDWLFFHVHWLWRWLPHRKKWIVYQSEDGRIIVNWFYSLVAVPGTDKLPELTPPGFYFKSCEQALSWVEILRQAGLPGELVVFDE